MDVRSVSWPLAAALLLLTAWVTLIRFRRNRVARREYHWPPLATGSRYGAAAKDHDQDTTEPDDTRSERR